ncbi:MAG TPA: EthD family reductase [Terriglobales bacterium]|nr:EthD family reductase [Terriglobales bacterium]
MIRFSVLYPNGSGKTFDIDYYVNRHIPMVRQLLGSALKGVSVEHGLSGMEPGDPPAFLALGHLLFDSVEACQAAFAPHAAKIVADVPKYTNSLPTIQISQVCI